MSRVFLSHSSHDGLEAVALKQWLIGEDPALAEEVFLDLDPHTGLAPGQRWKEALQRSTARCEAVICLLSAHWEASAECRTEYRTAENLGKLIFCARLEPEATGEVTAQWQRCDLFGMGPVTEIPVEVNGQARTVSFLADGLERLLRGLRRAGIGSDYFPWPPADQPDRAPYRGWEPLEEMEAAVFFGRDAAILRGLDALRGMRTTGTSSLFVILGPSGVGKSSFLRAGLLPRLRRDDRHFVLLDVMRPERAPLTGERGFAASLYRARSQLGLKTPALGVIKAACTAGDTTRLKGWLEATREAAAVRLPENGEKLPVPTVVLPVDQAEELFSVDAGTEAPRFLELLAELVHVDSGTTPGLIVVGTIRADFYEPLQTAPALAGLEQTVFSDLKPMPQAEFKDVITGPADRASAAGHPLTIEAALVERLVTDSDQGADTLPLLALTLASLYRDYGANGTLTLGAYEAMGGMSQVVQGEINTLLAAEPVARQRQLELLRAAFIPWLATINPDNDQPIRRVAHLEDLPAAARLLIEAMVDKRLLVKDTRDGHTVIEVALESLLRQWEDLTRWLTIERRNLIEADALERAAAAWEDNGWDEAWLLHGLRLAGAEALVATPHFAQRLRPTQPFLRASRQREDDRAADEQLRHEAQLQAAHDKAAAESKARKKAQTYARRLKTLLTAMVVVALVAVTGLLLAVRAEREADARTQEAIALQLTAEAQAMLADARRGGDARAIQQLLIAHALAPTLRSQEGLIQGVAERPQLEKIMEDDTPIGSVAFNPDGTRIASGSRDGTIRFWDAATGQPQGQLETGHRNWVLSVAFSPDGTRIASASNDNTLRVWDVQTRLPVGPPMAGHEGSVWSLAFSRDGAWIASGGGDGTIRLWDARTGEPLGEPLTGHQGTVNSVAFSPEGDLIVSGSRDGTMKWWDTRTGEALDVPMNEHEGTVHSVAFSPDGDRIASGTGDGHIQVWDAATRQVVGQPIAAHSGRANGRGASVAFSPDGTRIASGGGDGTIRLWDAATGDPVGAPMTGHEGGVFSVAFSPDGTRIASGAYDSTVRVWNARAREVLGAPMTGHEGGVSDVAFSPDGAKVASGGGDGTIRLWDVATGKPIGKSITFPPGEGGAAGLAFSPDGDRIVSGSRTGPIRIWDPITGEQMGEPLIGHEGTVHSVAFSPNGDWIVSGGFDRTVRMWDVAVGQEVGQPMTGHDDSILSVAFSPDGTRIASGGLDDTVRVWDSATRQQLEVPLTGHEGPVDSVAFSPDGGRIVSGGYDGTVRVWDAGSGEPFGEPMAGHESSVYSVAFSPDGNRIASGSQDDAVRVWALPDVWPSLLCAKLTENISHEQWREWVSPDIEYHQACPGLPIRLDAAAG